MPEPSQLESGRRRPISRGEYTSIRFPKEGEIVFLRVDTTHSTTSSVPSSDLTITTATSTAEGRNNFRPHPCIVLRVHHHPAPNNQNKWSLDVLVIRSYRHVENAVDFVSNLTGLEHKKHLPMPPPGSYPPLPTPAFFGDSATTSLVPKSYSWIIAQERWVPMGFNSWVRSESVLKIVRYR